MTASNIDHRIEVDPVEPTIHQMLMLNGMTTRIPEFQYQPAFDKKGKYSRKGYAFGKQLRLKRKK